MKTIFLDTTRFFCCLMLLTHLSCSTGDGIEPAEEKNTPTGGVSSFITCGDDRVIQLTAGEQGANARVVWQWSASETVGLPSSYLAQLTSMDECKSSPSGDTLLLTSSSLGAVMVLEKATKRALFYAKAPNAHSAEFLPNNRIAVANSIAQGGNSLVLYDLATSETALYSEALYSGHGVVWIAERERLFALGFNELRMYSLENWESHTPKLYLERTWNLPDDDGHDLSRVSKDKLLLTTKSNVWEFDIASSTFVPFKPLQNIAKVKSVNYNPLNGQILYTQGEASWWTHTIYSMAPDRGIYLPNVRLYKVRFIHPE